MRIRVIPFVIVSVVVSLLVIPTGASGVDSERPRIDQALEQALQENTPVAVIVSLADPAGGAQEPIASARRSAIAMTQARVLDRATGFAPARRYTLVPAIAGHVTKAGLAQLAVDPDVVAVSLDVPVRATLSESVLHVGAHLAHSSGVTGAGTTVAVFDTGIDTDHSDLADDLLSEACFLESTGPGPCHNGESSDSGPGSAEDDHGHGSHVSGIVTSAGNISPRGIAFDTGIRAYKILNEEGSGVTSDILAALDDVILNYPDTDAINMSLGDGGGHAAGTCDDLIPALTTAVATLRAGGTVVVGTSGNDADKSGMSYPGCVSAVVSTGAVYDADLGSVTYEPCTDSSSAFDQVPCFSNSNASLRMLAPGCAIQSSWLDDTTANLCGTSMAAPHVAAAVALLRDFDDAMTANDVESCLETTGVPVTDPANSVTTPRLNVGAALGCAGLAVGGLADLPSVRRPAAGSGVATAAAIAGLAGLTAVAALGAAWRLRRRLRQA